MWSDNAATSDFLNFSVLAKVIAGTIRRNGDRPLSIGISGAWGVGKSTTLELLAKELLDEEAKPIIVRFQPWRHQTQDNVRAAFAECIARSLESEEDIPTEIRKKARSILKRANLIRIAGYGLGGALTLATGMPIGGFFSRGADALSGMFDGEITKEDMGKAVDFGKEAAQTVSNLFPEGEQAQSPYENIERICEDFESALCELDRRLIVLIDDLDRCLPNTTIEALEAMRLYFFVPRTVFVVAADEEMLRLAVRKHFEVSQQTLDETHLQSYYDKLIQLPFRIPSLTVQDVIVYMTLLVLEQQSGVSESDQIEIRDKLCVLLGKTWDGSYVSRAKIMEIIGDKAVESEFESRIAMIEQLAPRMVSSRNIGGNPRLIKRFMNSLMVRQELARILDAPEGTSEDVLAKILLLQRCGERKMVEDLEIDILKSTDGRSQILSFLEKKNDDPEGQEGNAFLEDLTSGQHWQTDFAKDWISSDPPLSNIDLRAALHVSRGEDHSIVLSVKLSQDSKDLLHALKDNPQIVDRFLEKIQSIPNEEVGTVMNHLINRLRTASDDEFLKQLNCCLAVEKAHESQSPLLLSTLLSISPNKFSSSSGVVLRERPWADVLHKHLKGKLPDKSPVLKSFSKRKK